MRGMSVLSALIGLSGAVGSNGKKDNTDLVVAKALLLISSEGSNDVTQEFDMVKAIKTEKYLVSPGCEFCSSPCGNTSDYDLTAFENQSSEVKKAKAEIMDILNAYASALLNDVNNKTIELSPMVYKGIDYLGYDLTINYFNDFISELKNL